MSNAERSVDEMNSAFVDVASNSEQQTAPRLDILQLFPWLKKFFQLRSFQFLLIFPNLVFFYFFILAGIFGSPVGNRNIIIIFVWIFWWFLLITFMVPFFSRLWCIMCPIPFLGEWFQRGALIKVRDRMFGLNKRWPNYLSNLWIQNIGFMILGTFFIILATRPFVSAVVLGGLFVLSTLLAVVYQRRVFCSYVCPVSGFLGIYAMSSMIELRRKDSDVCARCKTKSCAVGNQNGWACPWFLYVGKLDRNNNCGLCMECIKTCESQNISLFLRPFFSDTQMKGYDEVWKAFVMLALALIYTVVLFGPWGVLRDWANVTEVGDWGNFLFYTFLVWSFSLLILPALWALTTYVSKIVSGSDKVLFKKLFVAYSYVLVPLGLCAWIAFSIPLVMVNGSYVISIISDPLGYGWDIFGTAQFPWSPFYPEYAIYLQVIALLLGLGFAIKKGYEIGIQHYADEQLAVRSLIPVALFSLIITGIFLKVFTG